MKEKTSLGSKILSLTFAVLSVFWLIPIFLTLINSFKSNNFVNLEAFALPNAESFVGMANYIKGMITNGEVIEKLLEMAKEIAEAENQANALGLSKEEKAFYDALTKPRAIQDFYSNDQLVEMTKELTDALRKNRTIDWQKKESARAGMRRLIKRLLKKYKYPPEEEQNAMDIVLKQCEQWADVEPEYVYNE